MRQRTPGPQVSHLRTPAEHTEKCSCLGSTQPFYFEKVCSLPHLLTCLSHPFCCPRRHRSTPGRNGKCLRYKSLSSPSY